LRHFTLVSFGFSLGNKGIDPSSPAPACSCVCGTEFAASLMRTILTGVPRKKGHLGPLAISPPEVAGRRRFKFLYSIL
jgi:hypothetical protein